MEKRKAILIPCPQYGRLVRGSCACDEEGRYRRGPEGEFILDLIRCDQFGGRCMETLCALHRHNRRGPGTWFPGRILAAPVRKTPNRDARKPISRGSSTGTDVLC